MATKIAIALIVSAAVSIGVTTYVMHRGEKTGAVVEQQSDFNIMFRYGKNVLNTFDGTYTKDMRTDPPITIHMTLTKEELATIEQSIRDLDLFKPEPLAVPWRHPPCPSVYSSYTAKVQMDGAQKEIGWDYCEGEPHIKFPTFGNMVTKLIEAKEEYKKMPSPEPLTL